MLANAEVAHDAAPPPTPCVCLASINAVAIARPASPEEDGHNDASSCGTGSTELVDDALTDWSHMAAALPINAAEPAVTCHNFSDSTMAAIAAFNENNPGVTANQDDPTVRWYAVTVGLNVGVFTQWYVALVVPIPHTNIYFLLF